MKLVGMDRRDRRDRIAPSERTNACIFVVDCSLADVISGSF